MFSSFLFLSESSEEESTGEKEEEVAAGDAAAATALQSSDTPQGEAPRKTATCLLSEQLDLNDKIKK